MDTLFTQEKRLNTFKAILISDLKNELASMDESEESIDTDLDLSFNHNGLLYNIGLDFDHDDEIEEDKISIYLNLNVDLELITTTRIMEPFIFKEDNIEDYVTTHSVDILKKIDDLVDRVVQNKLCFICFHESVIHGFCNMCYFKRATIKGTDENCPVCLQNISLLYNTMVCCQKNVHIECLNEMRRKHLQKCPICNIEGIHYLIYSPSRQAFVRPNIIMN